MESVGANRNRSKLSLIEHVCCGGVVLDRLSPDGELVLIEVDKGRQPRWLLPKGHAMTGEQFEEAARREVSEETGIPQADLSVLAYLGKIEYSFPVPPSNQMHRKTVHFYFMLSASTTLIKTPFASEEGISSAHWFPIQAAKDVVRYDGNREVIERAETILEQLLAKGSRSSRSA
jgi:8-oxo-dGTP pyrophosphatase MutT (NUDIX family)